VGYTGMWADKVRAMTLFYYPSEFLYGKYTLQILFARSNPHPPSG
jgi:hypothetical protein